MDQSPEHRGLQWKWVWISLGMFLVLYVLPMLGAAMTSSTIGHKLIGGWSFGGVLLIAGIAGMISEGTTIWEPAIAGALMTILLYGGIEIVGMTRGLPVRIEVSSLVIALVAIFGLSLLGAGLGEGIQNVSRQKKEKATAPVPPEQ